MKHLSAAVVFLFACIFTLKISDIAFKYFVFERQVLIYGGEGRGLVLRELAPYQDVKIYPTVSDLVSSPTLVDKEYWVRTDSNGFILSGNEIIAEPSHNILFLGGSTTESRFVGEKQRFPSIIERRLRNEGYEANVYNGGVAGSHSFHSNLVLLGKSLPLNFTAALWLHNVNDLSLLSKTTSYWLAPRTKSIVIEPKNRENSFSAYDIGMALKNLIFPNIYGYLKPRLLPGLEFRLPDEYLNFRSNLAPSSIDLREMKQQFRRSIETFIYLCRVWEIEPILMTQFNQIEANTETFKYEYSMVPGIDIDLYVKLYSSFNEIIRVVAEENEVVLIDLATGIPADSDYMYDSVHLTEIGSAEVAEIVTPFIIDALAAD